MWGSFFFCLNKCHIFFYDVGKLAKLISFEIIFIIIKYIGNVVLTNIPLKCVKPVNAFKNLVRI